jgi:hypothetical protein
MSQDRLRSTPDVVAAWLLNPPALLVCALAALATLVFDRLNGNAHSGPLAGSGDIGIWEYIGYYASHHIRFRPLPYLVMSTDEVLFPYGGSNLLQPWGFERDGFFGLLFSLAGPGPWLQIYYSFSTFLTIVGAYWLLRSDFGIARAALVGVLVTFFNFYGSHEYPSHLNICVAHWTVLSILADFVIVRRVVLRHRVPLRMVLARVALTALSMGQDLGYVAGFGLMSLTVSTGFLFALGVARIKRRPAEFRGALRRCRTLWAAEARQHKVVTGVLIVVSAAAGFLYVPLALQVAFQARAFDFSGMKVGEWYASPWRLLLPYFPFVNPVVSPFRIVDMRAGVESGAIGWTLLVLGVGGLYCARRQWLMYAPVMLLLLACLAYRPVGLPILKIFPWFAFARVADRSTMIYPVLFAALALSFTAAGLGLGPRRGRALGVTMFALGAVEVHTSLSIPRYSRMVGYSASFFEYMAVVRQTPGEAILDWPFCMTGGNGVGSAQGLCPYYNENHLDLSYAPYHQKKLVGMYFGRLHPSQLLPVLLAHWDRMFAPDDPDIFRARRQTRCFDDDEWQFFTEFFADNDFAGLQLHASLLAPGCAEEFYTRFGRPRAQLSLPGGRELTFVPKDGWLRGRWDPALGQNVKLVTTFHPGVSALDALEIDDPAALEIDGLSVLEHLGNEQWRWGLGATTRMAFAVSGEGPLTLRFSFLAPDFWPGVHRRQTVEVVINGAVVARFGDARPIEATWNSADIPFQGQAGRNSVEFRCAAWNENALASGDPRPMSIRFARLRVE